MKKVVWILGVHEFQLKSSSYKLNLKLVYGKLNKLEKSLFFLSSSCLSHIN
jgi:hypothetical protein